MKKITYWLQSNHTRESGSHEWIDLGPCFTLKGARRCLKNWLQYGRHRDYRIVKRTTTDEVVK